MSAIPAILNYQRPDLVRNVIGQLSGTPLIAVIENGCANEYDDPAGTGIGTIVIPENRYFSGGWNYAMRLFYRYGTRFEWVWMLNSDVEGVSQAMLAALLETALKHDAIAVSPAFNSPHSHMQPQGRGARRVNWIDWTAPLVNVEKFSAAGMFDEDFKGYGADLDLAWRAKQLGYAMYVNDDLVINHLGSQTALSQGEIGAMCNVEAMNALLRHKYGVGDWAHFARKLEG